MNIINETLSKIRELEEYIKTYVQDRLAFSLKDIFIDINKIKKLLSIYEVLHKFDNVPKLYEKKLFSDSYLLVSLTNKNISCSIRSILYPSKTILKINVEYQDSDISIELADEIPTIRRENIIVNSIPITSREEIDKCIEVVVEVIKKSVNELNNKISNFIEYLKTNKEKIFNIIENICKEYKTLVTIKKLLG